MIRVVCVVDPEMTLTVFLVVEVVDEDPTMTRGPRGLSRRNPAAEAALAEEESGRRKDEIKKVAVNKRNPSRREPDFAFIIGPPLLKRHWGNVHFT